MRASTWRSSTGPSNGSPGAASRLLSSTRVWLARRLLAGRTTRVGLAALAELFGTSVRPCHRALADAEATAEILLALVGLAQERGACTVSDLVELAAPRARRLHAKRALVAAAPATPGIYVFRDRHDQALYVGRARDLRARLRSYFGGERQRPAVEAALGALARVEWRPLGNEVEAALEELRMLRELRPPANARGTRPDRHVYLRRRGAAWVSGTEPSAHGPLKSRQLARRATRALDGFEGAHPADALPPLRERLRRLARDQRFEDAARLRDRIAALEQVVATIGEMTRLRSLRVCVLAPAREPGFLRAFFVAGGRIAATRTLPRGGGAVDRDPGRPCGCRARSTSRSPPRTRTSSSCSPRSCAGRRRRCASPRSMRPVSMRLRRG